MKSRWRTSRAFFLRAISGALLWHANCLCFLGMSGIITLAARDAASDAAHAAYKATVELWTLYSFGVAVTLLRTYARVRAVGWRNLRADDYLIWIAIVCSPDDTVDLRSILMLFFLDLLYRTNITRLQCGQIRPWPCKQQHDRCPAG